MLRRLYQKKKRSIEKLSGAFKDRPGCMSWMEIKKELIEAGYHHRADLAVRAYKNAR